MSYYTEHSFAGVPTGSTGPQAALNPFAAMLAAIPGAQDAYGQINAASPRSFGGFIGPALQEALAFQMKEGGMPAAEYDASRKNIAQSLNSTLSRAAAEGAARGGDPRNQGIQGDVAAAFGTSLATLEGARQKAKQDSMTTALNSLTSMAGIGAEESRAGQAGFGELLAKGAAAGAKPAGTWWMQSSNGTWF